MTSATTDDRPHLLVSAYAFSPVLGSEFAQGWNYVATMREHFRLTVLVGSSDGRMGDFSLLDHPAARSLQDVRIVPVQGDWFCRLIKWLDVDLKLSWLFVFGLRRWHWLAFRAAAALHAVDPIAVAHQLGPVGFRNPGFLYRLGVPSYWGPIGGYQYIRLSLARRSSLWYGAVAMIRNVSTFFAARSPAVRKALHGFDRLSFATETNRRNFAALGVRAGPVLSDQASMRSATGVAPISREKGQLTVAWCGSIDARKNIRLLLDIAARLADQSVRCHFTVIGSGNLLPMARALVRRRRLGNITFTGQLAREAVREQLEQADVLSFTSLSEANTAALFEGLEAGCIPIALDLDGFSTNITPDLGFKVNADQPWADIVDDYSTKLGRLAGDHELRSRLSAGVERARDRFAWTTLAERHREIINDLLGQEQNRA